MIVLVDDDDHHHLIDHCEIGFTLLKNPCRHGECRCIKYRVLHVL